MKTVRILGTQVSGLDGIYPASEVVNLDDNEAELLIVCGLADATDSEATFFPKKAEEVKVEVIEVIPQIESKKE